MNKEKYRGTDAVTGKFVYGKWSPFGTIPCLEFSDGSLCKIESGSLERKVGRDKHGREIYRPAREIYEEAAS